MEGIQRQNSVDPVQFNHLKKLRNVGAENNYIIYEIEDYLELIFLITMKFLSVSNILCMYIYMK